jgi:serine/threonine protein kinase
MSEANLHQANSETAGWLRLEPGAEPVRGYRLGRELGRGGSGEVWQAVGPDGTPLALKIMRLDSKLEPSEASFLTLLQAIRHPHLLPMYATWQQPGYLIIAMELADCTLMDRHAQAVVQGLPGIPFDELIQFMSEAATGIDHLNEVQHLAPDEPVGQPLAPVEVEGDEDFSLRLGSIQHRDIKPANLFLVSGRVKVADFGLAKFTEHTVTKHSGAVTMAYAAPEFFQGQTTTRSDQYSLAVSYCQLRGGRLPFAGTPAQLVAGHLSQAPDLTMVPPAERPALARALAKKPEERWPNCRQFVEALRDCQGGERPLELAGELHTESTARPTLAAANLSPSPQPAHYAGRSKGPPRVALALVAVLLLALGASAVWSLSLSSKEHQNGQPAVVTGPEGLAELSIDQAQKERDSIFQAQKEREDWQKQLDHAQKEREDWQKQLDQARKDLDSILQTQRERDDQQKRKDHLKSIQDPIDRAGKQRDDLPNKGKDAQPGAAVTGPVYVVTIRNGPSVTQRSYYLDEQGQSHEVAAPRPENGPKTPQVKFPAQAFPQDPQQFEQMVLQNQEKVRQQIEQTRQQIMQRHQEMMQMQQTQQMPQMPQMQTWDSFGYNDPNFGSTLRRQVVPFPVANRLNCLPRRR